DALSQQLPTLYVTGEESGAQVALRSRRLGLNASRVRVQAEIQLEKILATLDVERPAVAVIDSIQTVYSDQLSSAPGSVAQVRECAAHLTRWAKASGCAVVLVGHVTKDGSLAGPKVLEHIVDTVLAFEGDRGHSLRALRTQKNRFGSATEVGVFEMTSEGMREVPNPSALFLAERPRGVAGSVIAATCEGTRSMLVEVQALASPFAQGSGRRTANGVDGARLAMVLAVLERKTGLAFAGA